MGFEISVGSWEPRRVKWDGVVDCEVIAAGVMGTEEIT
jgi:hypothetical protein